MKSKSEDNLLDDICVTRAYLDAENLRFDFISDPDLIESCIYNIKSLDAKYRYLLKQARELGYSNSLKIGY